MSRHLVVVGGGVIGLSIAWQAVQRNFVVTLIDRGLIGAEASWASAGILPYVNPQTAQHPLEKLAAASHKLHPRWYLELRTATGIDYEHHVAGTIHFARTRAEKASLIGLEQHHRDEQSPFQTLTMDELGKAIPSMQHLIESHQVTYATKLLADAQLRSPRFLAALAAACRQNGVRIVEQVGDVRLTSRNNLIHSAESEAFDSIAGDEFCVASGAWSGELLRPLGLKIDFVPIRGQMVFYQLDRRPFSSVVYEGGNYLVPRTDGTLLVGSTLEDVGFDRSTTPEAIDVLSRFAGELVPDIAGRAPNRVWAGLRPATFDGFPYIGRVVDFRNLTLAAGHFRAGIHLAPITAVAICQLLEELPFAIDLTPFRATRGRSQISN